VMNMLDRPTALFHPSIMWRVLRHAVAKRNAPAKSAGANA